MWNIREMYFIKLKEEENQVIQVAEEIRLSWRIFKIKSRTWKRNGRTSKENQKSIHQIITF